ncbi:MAG TPA: Uma2 family endonuclease [Gemmatimonadaceae bacterium]|nr:Uma2 family endonuclease [Gemmatimonadaceae bacterium]
MEAKRFAVQLMDDMLALSLAYRLGYEYAGPSAWRDCMASPGTARVWTPDQVRELVDDWRSWPRYECLDGELAVTPAPELAHQRVVGELFVLIRAYVRELDIGETFMSPADVQLDRWAMTQPDVFVIARDEGVRIRKWTDIRALLLAVEVISPSSARSDRGRKRDIYQRWQVSEYWIVDLDARLVERWRPGDERPEILRERLEWRPDPAREPLRIELAALFAEAAGD